MARRYLTLQEAASALNRGRAIESFLGGYETNNGKTIKWVSFSKVDKGIQGRVWEVLDEGSEDFWDIYSFSPASGEWNIPINQCEGANLEEVASVLSLTLDKLVNRGLVQDEYASYKSFI